MCWGDVMIGRAARPWQTANSATNVDPAHTVPGDPNRYSITLLQGVDTQVTFMENLPSPGISNGIMMSVTLKAGEGRTVTVMELGRMITNPFFISVGSDGFFAAVVATTLDRVGPDGQGLDTHWPGFRDS